MIVLVSSLLALPVLWRLWGVGSLADARELRASPSFLLPFGGLALALVGGGWIDDEVQHVFVGYLAFLVVPLVYVLAAPTLAPLMQRLEQRSWVALSGVIFALLFPLDVGVALDAERPVVEHQLSVLGFYVGLSLTLGLSYARLELRGREVFVVGGLLGLLVEQSFLGPALLVTNPLGFLIYAPTIFLTYALYLFAPWLLLSEALQQRERRTLRYAGLVLFLAAAVVPLVVWALCNAALELAGVHAPVLPI